jgi:dihydroorotate dehydrogenase electron transfer subunit
MAQENVKVLWNRKVAPGYMHMGLSGRTACADAQPGQFVMLRTDEAKDPLLRRPFSIHQVIEENGKRVGLELLYKVVGPVTERMARMEKDQDLDMVAPLGQGFRLPEGAKNIMIVGGGIGVAPVVFLASWLCAQGVDPARCRVLIGGRSRDDVLCADHFIGLGMTVMTATDDGSLGRTGRVTDLVAEALDKENPDVIYACGPHPMLTVLAELAQAREVTCQLSVETLMACGICACMGCAVAPKEDDGTYRHVCKNGPVFDARDLKWNDHA